MTATAHLSPTIVFDRAVLGYAGNTILTDVTFSVEAGEFAGIIGCSGAGKSTLLTALAGASVQLAGSVLVAGRDPRRSGHGVGLVPQLGDEVLTGLSLTEVVALGRPRRGLFTTRTERRDADDLLSRLGLGELRNSTVGVLSGGQRQRVAIARALMASQEVLLCDEPTSGADPSLTTEIIDVLGEVAASGTTVLVATHDLSVVAPRLDRLIGIADGGIRFDGPATEFGPAAQVAVYGRAVTGGRP